MKWSETCRDAAKESFTHGVIFLVLGCIALITTTAFAFADTEIFLPIGIAAVCLLFFGASTVSFFVDYPDFKDSQRIAEEEEALREREQQRQPQQN